MSRRSVPNVNRNAGQRLSLVQKCVGHLCASISCALQRARQAVLLSTAADTRKEGSGFLLLRMRRSEP